MRLDGRDGAARPFRYHAAVTARMLVLGFRHHPGEQGAVPGLDILGVLMQR